MTLNRTWALLLAGAWLVWSPQPAAAQGDHQYTSQDIQAGARIYSSQCALCHGANGDMVNGVDLRRGGSAARSPTRTSPSVITNGAAGGAMPPFKLSGERRRRSSRSSAPGSIRPAWR